MIRPALLFRFLDDNKMKDYFDPKLPGDLDRHVWAKRYDKMSEHYSPLRNERFQLMISLIRETQPATVRVLDMGCANGSLMHAVLEAMPQAEVIGIDHDPTVLWLAEARLKGFKDRYRLITADLLDGSWTSSLQESLDAIISSHTLHMFEESQLAALYRCMAKKLRSGAIFLSSDHVRSNSPVIQKAWEKLRSEAQTREEQDDVDEWENFWDRYSEAAGLDIRKIHEHLTRNHKKRKKERLPLSWHFDRLLESGLSHVDCFWRGDIDAVYGGVK